MENTLNSSKTASLENVLDSGCNLSSSASCEGIVQAPSTTEWLSLALSVPIPTPVSENLNSELEAYSEHFENILRNDSILYEKGYLPIKLDSNDLIFACRDGVLLAHLLAKVKPDSFSANFKLNKLQYAISWSSLGEKNSKSVFELNAQISNVLKAAAHCGFVVVNLGSQDILCRKVDLVLGLVWQIMRAHMLQKVNLQSTPELIRLLAPGESIETLCKLNSENLLLRWVNFHLQKEGASQRVRNFSSDISSGEVYRILLKQVLYNEASCQSLISSPLEADESDIDRVLKIAEKAGVRQFVTAKEIAKGNPKLNLAFTASVFNKYIGINLPSEDDVRAMLCRITELEQVEKEQAEQIRSLASQKQELTTQVGDFVLQVQSDEKQAQETQTAHRVAVTQFKAEISAFETRVSDAEALLNQISRQLATFTTEFKLPFESKLEFTIYDHKADNLSNLPSSLALTLEQLAAAIKFQQTTNLTLATQLAQTQKLNDLMSSKIGQVAESMIEERKKEFKIKVKKDKNSPAGVSSVSSPSEASRPNQGDIPLSPAF